MCPTVTWLYKKCVPCVKNVLGLQRNMVVSHALHYSQSFNIDSRPKGEKTCEGHALIGCPAPPLLTYRKNLKLKVTVSKISVFIMAASCPIQFEGQTSAGSVTGIRRPHEQQTRLNLLQLPKDVAEMVIVLCVSLNVPNVQK